MTKIRIVNWLLTRRCNLKCDYCAIVKNYASMPTEYPKMSHYLLNEMTTDDVISGLTKFKEHNPDAFHIFYGGEPMLRRDLPDIINFCNQEDIHYTIISNNTPEIKPMIKNLFEKTDEVKGFTASIDPVIFDYEGNDSDRVRKSLEGIDSLLEIKQHVNDVVAEITVMNENLRHLHRLVNHLTLLGINSDITFIDISKSPYYDFSNITDQNLLVRQSAQLADQFQKLNDGKYNIHMKDLLLRGIWDTLPSNMDCKIDENLHNVSVDADGTIRLCLRIRGVHSPKLVNLKNLLDSTGRISPIAHSAIKTDKEKYCKLCNHTCHIMSKHIDANDTSPDDLVHLDRRK